MSIFTGNFRDIDNGLYRVTFNCEKGDTTKEITLGGSPFVTDMDGDSDTLYSPAKYLAATIEIVESDYLFDLYNGKALGTSVTLEKYVDNKYIKQWVGYVEPNLYSLGFEEYLETIEVNCIDGLSTLQYFKYDTENINTNITFNKLISKLLTRCNCYDYFYISTNLKLKLDSTDSILDKLFICQRAFYEERKDSTETDEDLAMTMQDVLEELCRYLGVTVIADGADVYFIDYDALKAGNYNYYKYDVANGDLLGTVSISSLHNIKGDDYAENGATISLDNVYNKIVVSDRFKEIEEIDVDLFDVNSVENITADEDRVLQSILTSIDSSSKTTTAALSTVDDMILTLEEVVPTKVERLFDITYNIKEDKHNNPNFVAVRYLKHPRGKCYSYKIADDKMVAQTYPTTLNYFNSLNLLGALLAQFYTYECPYKWRKRLGILAVSGEQVLIIYNDELDAMTFVGLWTDGVDKYNTAGSIYEDNENLYFRASKWHYGTEYPNSKDLVREAHEDISARGLIPQLKVSNYIVLSTPYLKIMSLLDANSFDKLPYFELNGTTLEAGMIGGNDTYLVISGSINWNVDKDKKGTSQFGLAYPIPKGLRGIKTDQYIKSPFETYIYCWLKYDNWMWNGREWVEDATGNTFFKLYYMEAGSTDEERKIANIICSDLPIRNNIDYTMGLGDKSGTAIPIPSSWGILTKTPIFGICKPHFPELNKYDSGKLFELGWLPHRVFIKDLKLEFAMGNTNKVNLDTDTAYSNTIDDGNAIELSDIEFKITSYDDKKLSYTNVGYMDGDKCYFLLRVINSALYDKELSYYFNNGVYALSDDGLKQEEHTVFKLVNQYSQPAIKLELNLKDICKVYGIYTDTTIKDKSFIVDTISIDYRNKTHKVNLIEKF